MQYREERKKKKRAERKRNRVFCTHRASPVSMLSSTLARPATTCASPAARPSLSCLACI